MDRQIETGLGGDKLFTWAADQADAIRVASAHMGVPQPLLAARYTGLTRPGSYDIEGNPIDGETESVGTSMRRYAVTPKAGK